MSSASAKQTAIVRKPNASHRAAPQLILGIGLVLGACGTAPSTGGAGGTGGAIPQCTATSYLAFDSGNHQNQDIRVATYTRMTDLMTDAKSDYTLAADRFTQTKDLYTDLVTAANLRDKVQGRNDDHLTGSPLQGDRLDVTIMQWLNAGIAATNNLEANLAKQWVDKTMIEFFFLSVHHELVAGTRKNWDEAYGYYGAKADNDEANLEGLAKTTFKRDTGNGTNVGAEIFNNLIDGSCALEVALRDGGTDKIEPSSDATLSSLVDNIDLRLQRVLAYSAGHEAFGMQSIIAGTFDPTDSDDTDDMWVKMAELAPFFVPLGRIMEAKGGDSLDRANEINALIDQANFSDLTDIGWMTTFATQQAGAYAPERIIELLEAEFGIDVKS